MQSTPVKSEQIRFAQKYDYARAVDYYHRFNRSPRKRFLNWLEQCMAKRGLTMANMPTHILDIPSGTGRFWQTLHHNSHVKLHAADFNSAMIDVGFEKRDAQLTQKMQGAVASAFSLPFPDNSFDSIFCMRFIHHINLEDDRMQLLRELARVTADTVCISSWIDDTGIKAQSRLKKEKSRKANGHYDKFVHQHQQIIQEFTNAGFELIGYTDLLPHLSPWRLYVLRKKHITPPIKLSTVEYVCPLCKGTLTNDLAQKQFTCHHDKLAFPMHGKLPMLTQRDAIKLT
jgi:ubiquinone/menaquinone biosynthesis C-methylase UbiE